MHSRCRPKKASRVTSNSWTYTSPTSWRTHSSNTSTRNCPYCRAPTVRSVTRLPVCVYSRRLLPLEGSLQPWLAISSVSGVARSTIGMNCTHLAPSSSRKKRYTSRPCFSLAAFTVHKMLNSTPCLRSCRQPCMTRSKVPFLRRSSAVGVVQLARAIDAQAHQKIVLLEEGAPVVVQQDAVGLKGVLHDLARPAIFFDQLD